MAVAPEVPAAGLFVVGLAFAATALFLVFLRFGAVTLVGGLLRWLAGIVSWVPFVGHFGVDAVNAGVNFVDAELGKAVHAAAGTSVSLLEDSWKLTRWVGDAMADLATATEHALSTIVTSTIPNAVHTLTHPIAQDIAAVEERLGSIERTAVKDLRAEIAGLERQAGKATRKLEREIAAAETAVIGATAGTIKTAQRELWHGIDELRDTIGKRLSKIEKSVGLVALTGVIVSVVAKHWRWIRCPNVAKVGNHLCNMPVRQLEDLLAQAALGSLVIFGTVSLVEFAETMLAVEEELVGAITHGFRELNGIS